MDATRTSKFELPSYLVVEHNPETAQRYGIPLRPFCVYRSSDGMRLASFADRARAENYITIAERVQRNVALVVGGR